MDNLFELAGILILFLGVIFLYGFIWLIVTTRETKKRTRELTLQINGLERKFNRWKQGGEALNPPLPSIQAPPPILPSATQAASPSAEPLPPPPVPPPLPKRAFSDLITEMPIPSFSEAESYGSSFHPEESAPSVSPPLMGPKPTLNLEKFLGVNLVGWVAGIVALLGVVFGLKYSFEHNWISPQLRVAMGLLLGTGLVVWGVLIARGIYSITAEALAATGILILYADIFASNAYYHLMSSTPNLGAMTLITATAFFLSVRLDSRAVAILAMVGGFLTPPLLSTGQDNPMGLFGYVALLDAGLVAVAFRKEWNFLVFMGAMGTAIMQAGWVLKFFAASKILVAMAIFLGFTAFFVAAFMVAHRLKKVEEWITRAAIMMPSFSMAFALYLLWRPYPEIAQQPGLFFSFVFLADLALMAMSCLDDKTRSAHAWAGCVSFFILGTWTADHLRAEWLNWALGTDFFFAVIHAIFPVILQKLRPTPAPSVWVHVFPAAGLAMILLPMLNGLMPNMLFWPVVCLIDLTAIILAALTASIMGILAVLILTMIAAGIWILNIPVELFNLPPLLGVIGGFALFFYAAGIFAARRIVPRMKNIQGGEVPSSSSTSGLLPEMSKDAAAYIPSFATVMPFILLAMAITRVPLANPSPIFGLAALLSVLILAVVVMYGADVMAAIGLGCVLMLEHVWQAHSFHPENAFLPLCWYFGFFAIFASFPFLFENRFRERLIPWGVGSLSGPGHFYLVYALINAAYKNPYMGLIPAAFAIPSVIGLFHLIRKIPAENIQRNSQLALFGGAALFFITLIFPIQFENQWITIGWALEGVALLWLFQRVPHEGLRLLGTALLVIAFVRLAFNPAVFEYHPRSGRAIFNWYLYGYGMVSACLLAGGRLLAPPNHLIKGFKAPSWLYGMGGVLAFFLLNIEIADYFSTGSSLTWQFTGSFARDMSYSLGWALFATILLVIGFRANHTGSRYSGLGLMAVTLLKLFLHDLWILGGLYRIVTFLGLAVILFLVSFIYQRFLSRSQKAVDTQHENS